MRAESSSYIANEVQNLKTRIKDLENDRIKDRRELHAMAAALIEIRDHYLVFDLDEIPFIAMEALKTWGNP